MPALACAACGFENRADSRFCGRCGAPLGRSCASCGAVVEAGLAFCTACGAPQATEEPLVSPPAEERKVVSVLFVDLVGFTSRAESLDPEDLRRLLSPYFARVREELGRFGGTVEKMIGDAVVGFFGAPSAHEDDPERAVRAALAVREAIGELNRADPSLDLQVRAGVTTGEAVIDLAARADQGEQLGAGDVVVTAARLQANAPVGGILVDAATYRATERAIEYGEELAVDAKGKAERVRAWPAVAPRARLGIDIAFRGRAALVGRRGELDLLTGALSRAQRERSTQLVTLVGEPGMGKSRLVYELFAWIEGEEGLLVTWRQGRSLPYGEGVSFWAFGEMVKAQAGILENDPAEAAEEKLVDAVDDLLDRPDAEWVCAHLRPLVGLAPPYEPRAEGQAEAFAAWRRFVEALAERRPLALVFEDLHWADDGLLEFVDHLVSWTTEVPLLVLCTARPELVDRAPSWGGGKLNATTIVLAPLSGDETEELLGVLLDTKPDPELVGRTGGNPLYAEEYARMLSERGDDAPLPDSIQGVIAARLDRLPPEEKALVQDAAVVGKVFWAGTLASTMGLEPAIIDRRLRVLERKEFVRRERRSSVEGETAYVFRHVLVRDVAYAQIPRARRADRHRRTAEWLELAAGGRSENVAEMLAHHYVQALEYARSTGAEPGDVADRARRALREAGDRAGALNAFRGAARFYEQALGLWPDDGERPQLLLRLGRAVYHARGGGVEILAEAAEELLDAGDRAGAAEAEVMLAELAWLAGRRDSVSAHSRAAGNLVADEPASPAKAYVLANLSRLLSNADENERAIRAGFEAFTMADELAHEELQAHTLITIGTSRALTGDLGGIVDLERAIGIARSSNSPQSARGLNNLATAKAHLGDLRRAFELYEEARREAERFGHVVALRWLAGERVMEHYSLGRWDEALSATEALFADSDDPHGSLQEMEALAVRAKIAVARGDLTAAERWAGRAVELAQTADDPQSLFSSHAVGAHVAVAAGRTDGATRHVDRLFENWDAVGPILPTWWLADLAIALEGLERSGELEEATHRVALATPWFEAATSAATGNWIRAAGLFAEIGSLPDEAYARLRAAEQFALAARRGEAERELAVAVAFFTDVGASALLERAENVLAARA